MAGRPINETCRRQPAQLVPVESGVMQDAAVLAEPFDVKDQRLSSVLGGHLKGVALRV